jgi:site-specific recombinase XerD
MYPKFATLTAGEQKRLLRALRATKDLYLTQRFAGHSSPLTTTVYTHPTDEELYEGIRRIHA